MQLLLLHYTSLYTRYVVTLYSNLPPLAKIKKVLKFGTCETTCLLPRVYSTCVCTVQPASNVPPPFQIKRVRKATREEKKRRAMAMRQKELGALGMEVNEKGQVIAQSTLVSEMEGQLIEESGLKCCICLEGYKNQPQKVC